MPNDLMDMHPKLKERREETRTPIALCDIYDNADVKVFISDDVKSKEQFNWVIGQLEECKNEILKMKDDENYGYAQR